MTFMSLLAAAGCAVQAPSELPVLPKPVDTAEATPAPSDAGAIPHDDLPAHMPESDIEAAKSAINAVDAFCRPSLAHQTWINGLFPFLSQTAALAYETVDPAKVPCTAVTGDARARDGDGTFTIRVIVPTNAGEYSVYVHRPEVTDPWLVEQITSMAGN